MQKELVVCIIIVITIIVGNVLTHNNTKNAVAEMNKSLQNVSSKIFEDISNKKKPNTEISKSNKSSKNGKNIEENQDSIENVNKEIEQLIITSKEIWDKKYQALAYYIEHDELEKVSEALVRAKSNINAEEYNTAIENIDGCIFLLQHIEEKDKFSLKNIF